MRKPIPYKQDTLLLVSPMDAKGEAISFSDYDWDAYVRTSPYCRAFHASHHGHTNVNCKPGEDGKSIFIILDRHGLPPGPLSVDMVFHIPNDLFPDGTQDVPWHEELNYELVPHSCCPPSAIEVKAVLPFAKGEPGAKGTDGKDGRDGRDGRDGNDGRDGEDGRDGHSPKIIDGNWHVYDDVSGTWIDSGVAAAGTSDEPQEMTDEDIKQILDEVLNSDQDNTQTT